MYLVCDHEWLLKAFLLRPPAGICSTSEAWRRAFASNICSSVALWSSMLGMSGWSFFTLSSSPGSITSQSSRICQMSGRRRVSTNDIPDFLSGRRVLLVPVWNWRVSVGVSFMVNVSSGSFCSLSKTTMPSHRRLPQGNGYYFRTKFDWNPF